MITVYNNNHYAFYGHNKDAAIYVAGQGKTFICFQGLNYNSYMTSYTHSTGAIATPVLVQTATLSNNSHGVPSFCIDSASKLRVIGCGYSDTDQKYSISDNAHDFSAWTAQAALEKGTYRNLYKLSNNDILFFYRQGTDGTSGQWVERTNFGAATTVFSQLASGAQNWYLTTHQDPANADLIHVAGVWNDANQSRGGPAPGFTNRYNVYYCQRASGTWKEADGTAITLPIDLTFANSDLQARANMAGSTPFCNVWGMANDGSSRPGILYNYGSGTSHNWRFTFWNGSSWTDSEIAGATTDHVFDDGCLEYRNSAWHAYLVRGGTSGARGDTDSGMEDRGGDLEHWQSSNGTSWTFVKTVLNGRRWMIPQVVKNAHDDLRVLICSNSPTEGIMNGTLVGLSAADLDFVPTTGGGGGLAAGIAA